MDSEALEVVARGRRHSHPFRGEPSDQLNIAIVGGGVAGLGMANALAARGISSTVYERASEPGEIDRGDVIHESILKIIRTWRLSEHLRACGPLKLTKFFILNHDGKELLAFDLSHDLRHAAAFTVLRHPQIQRMLEIAAVKTGLVKVERCTAGLQLIEREGRVVGLFTSRGEVTTRLTILATGSHSRLRDDHFPKTYYKYPVSFYNCRFRLIPKFSDAGFYILGNKGVMVIAPLPKNEMRIGIQQYDTYPERMTPEKIVSVARERLRTLSNESLELIDVHRYPIARSLCSTFWVPGVAVIGDAAHTTHPVGGQGMNLAFQDAELLADCIATASQSDADIDKACQEYSTRRQSEIKKVLARTHMMGLMSTIKLPLLIKSRELVLRFANKSTRLKRAIFQRIVDVN